MMERQTKNPLSIGLVRFAAVASLLFLLPA